MRVVRCKNSLTVVLSGGRIIQTNDCTDEMFEQVKVYQQKDNEFDLINLLIPEKEEEVVQNVRLIKFWENQSQSSELTRDGNSVYWLSVSPLSMPMSFAERIMEAEKNEDVNTLEAYRNFWTLLSLNPDADVRKNLFKFLEKWGMVITKSGLFVGYRNADVYMEGKTADDTIYTDHHSGTTRIMIGHTVSIPRSKCDCNSNISCSSGLHLGGQSWLNKCYYGTVGLVCLCNPTQVCAVPWMDEDYGKLRTCAYLPIAIAEYDETGHVIPYRTDDGFEEPFVQTILYDGALATEQEPLYTIPMPRAIDQDLYTSKSVSDTLLNIARQYMK